MKLSKELSRKLAEGAYTIKQADAYQDAIQLAAMRPKQPARVDASRINQEITSQRDAPQQLKDWFDATPFDEKHRMKPVRVWDDSVPMKPDTRYDDWWEQPRRFFLHPRGPMTTSYDVSRYKPNGVGDYIIAFGGAGSGAGSEDFETLGVQYGGMGNIARFTWNQIPDAVKFAESLPKGSRLYVVGHSMGGDAAYRFADELGKKGGVIAGMDIRDPVRIDGRIAGLFRKMIPGLDSRRVAPKNVTRGVNTYNSGWFHNVNPFKWGDFTLGDVVSMAGGRYNDLRDTGSNWENIKAPPDYDHVMLGNVNNTDRFLLNYRHVRDQALEKAREAKLKNPHAQVPSTGTSQTRPFQGRRGH